MSAIMLIMALIPSDLRGWEGALPASELCALPAGLEGKFQGSIWLTSFHVL